MATGDFENLPVENFAIPSWSKIWTEQGWRPVRRILPGDALRGARDEAFMVKSNDYSCECGRPCDCNLLSKEEYLGKKMTRVFELLEKANRLSPKIFTYSAKFYSQYSGEVLIMDSNRVCRSITFRSLNELIKCLVDEVISQI